MMFCEALVGKHHTGLPDVYTIGAFVCGKLFHFTSSQILMGDISYSSVVQPHAFRYYVSKCSIFMISKKGLRSSQVHVRLSITVQCPSQLCARACLWFVVCVLCAVVIRSQGVIQLHVCQLGLIVRGPRYVHTFTSRSNIRDWNVKREKGDDMMKKVTYLKVV